MNHFVSKSTALFVLAIVLITACSIAPAQTIYSVTDLGDLPGGNDFSEAYGINDNGQVVGHSGAATGVRAFLWDSAGGMQDLGDLPGGDDGPSNAFGINNSGQVVGQSQAVTGNRATLWDSAGGMQDLGDLPGGGDNSWAIDINDNGQVVGTSNAATGDRAFLWDGAGGMQNLGDLPGGGDRSYGLGINDSGQVVGSGSAVTGLRAFLWDSVNGMQDLGDLPGGDDSSQANGINNSGQVVGESGAATGNRAFLWDGTGGMQDLGDLPGGDDWSWANDINDSGQVVGYSDSGAGGAFLWDSTNGMQALNDLLDSTGAGWTLNEANGISSSGQIVGRGINPNGSSRAFLLTPVVVLNPDQFNVVRGIHVGGDLSDSFNSDDSYLIFDPEFLSFRYQLEFTVNATSPSSAPSQLEFGYESRTLNFVGTVDQEIALFNYDLGQFETVDTRLATPTDSVVNVTPSGDPARFVEAGTNAMQARISYQNSLPFGFSVFTTFTSRTEFG